MRLLLRANAHRSTDEGRSEVAASLDTPNRERWRWHIRLVEVEPGQNPPEKGVRLAGGNGTQRLLQVSTDVQTARAEWRFTRWSDLW